MDPHSKSLAINSGEPRFSDEWQIFAAFGVVGGRLNFATKPGFGFSREFGSGIIACTGLFRGRFHCFMRSAQK